MNKNKKNRKGFTIVELVIVIAVIGILATVLVPTFGDVISDAKEKALLQEVKNAYTAYTADQADEEGYDDDVVIKVGDKYYDVKDGSVVDANKDLVVVTPAAGAKYWDATTAKMTHIYEAKGGEGADAAHCKHCDATAAH